MSEALIEFEAVSKVFASRHGMVQALDEISFTVERGDVFGLLGANGAGKTTAMRCILALTRINAGTLRVFGQARPDRRTLFARAAYLPEEPQLFQGATGKEHLRYFGRLNGVPSRDLEARVAEVLSIVGLAADGGRPIDTYSKGMKQRLGIAGAVLHRPEIIFLDEPTRGLDPIGRREVRDLLGRLAEEGVTLFLNSHLLGEVERLCNRVVIMDHGRVRATGLLSELLTIDAAIAVRFWMPEGVDGTTVEPTARFEAGAWQTGVADTAALAELAGKIAAAQGRVLSAQNKRLELEDFFLRVVRGDRP
jgi:ABC-2 type transport system ATP-binding protein